MKKLIYKIYSIIYSFILLFNLALIPFIIIYGIKIGVYASLGLTVLYLILFNLSSVSLSKAKIRYRGKEVTEDIKNDIIKKIFIKRSLMFGMAICAVISLIYMVIYYLMK